MGTQDDATDVMRLYAITIGLVLLVGCARFSTTQTDISIGEDGTQRKITTKATATTFAASKSVLSQWKASQTDKTQGATVGGLEQQSESDKLVDALVRALVQAITTVK